MSAKEGFTDKLKTLEVVEMDAGGSKSINIAIDCCIMIPRELKASYSGNIVDGVRDVQVDEDNDNEVNEPPPPSRHRTATHFSSSGTEITRLIGDFQVGHISLLKAESMMEEQQETRHTEIESEQENVLQEVQQPQQVKEENLLQFLDSVDGYLTLMDSLSSTLRQGWLELTSARHSMGASRISSVLLDLKIHSADTSVQVSQYDVDSMEAQPTFVLRKWAHSDNGEHSSGVAKPREDKLQIVSDGLQLRNRSGSQIYEEKALATNGTTLTLDDEVQKKRSKSLSVFGALVSPRLRASQLSFETALETLVEIANMRSTLLSTFDRVHEELEVSKG
ncbi:hypothetical protein LWI29_004246 [Acer saccharum]|uniref:Vacuolar ATPase assembly protein VMA22 n=1 Tax=Acer saccharum TaxID=4024 RepID=A0AA39W5H9_ACESA|nr:hypothetical protein LWI29_004246 [Acer saccharum]